MILKNQAIDRAALARACGLALSRTAARGVDFGSLRSPILFQGDADTAYRDPAAVYVAGEFRLFFTLVRREGDAMPWMYVATSRSRDLHTWTPLEILTPRDRNLNGPLPTFGGARSAASVAVN